jgi:hypothetical protein
MSKSSLWLIQKARDPMTNIYDTRVAISGGTLHHIGLLMQCDEAAERRGARCAWCDAELGRAPNRHFIESHGLCEDHLAQIKASLEMRRIAA